MEFHERIIYQRTTENRVGRKLLEKDIEKYGKKRCAELGWISEKFSSPEKRSVPDQIITAPSNDTFVAGFIFFIEYKAPDKKATPAQLTDHAERRMKGCLVMVCDSYEEVELAIEVACYTLNFGVVPKLPVCLTR